MLSISIPFFSPPSPLKPLHFLPQSSLLSPSPAGRTTLAARRLAAIGPDGKYYPSPVDDEPPEADEDTAHGVSKFQQIYRQASRARKLQEEQFQQDKSLFLSALAAEPDAAQASPPADASGDDFFGEIDRAIALKRQDFVKQGLLEPSQDDAGGKGIDELLPEEVVDVEEIQELQGLTVIDGDADMVAEEAMNLPGGDTKAGSSFTSPDSSSSSPFDLDFDSMSKTKFRVVEPKFKMTLAELLDESRVVPVSVYGNLNVTISGIQHDSREVSSGDLFVCCVGMKTDGTCT